MTGNVLRLQGLRLTKRGTEQNELNEVVAGLLEYLNKNKVCVYDTISFGITIYIVFVYTREILQWQIQ